MGVTVIPSYVSEVVHPTDYDFTTLTKNCLCQGVNGAPVGKGSERLEDQRPDVGGAGGGGRSSGWPGVKHYTIGAGQERVRVQRLDIFLRQQAWFLSVRIIR